MKTSLNFKAARTRLAIAAAIGGMLLAPTAWAQANGYPNKPVKLIVPFSAGGSVDAAARIVGQGLAQQLGQPVIIDNKPGADGSIATNEVIKSRPDGHTLLFATNTAILAVPTLRLKPPYDPLSALTPVGFWSRQSAFFLFMHPSVPANNLKELIGFAKANPGKLNYATGNSTGELAFVQMRRLAAMQVTKIPYKGEAPAVPDLLSGSVQIMLASTISLLTMAKEGKLKVLAVIGDKRNALAPEVPTFAEAGFSGITVIPWGGVFAPTGTPRDVIDRLSREMSVILRRPEVVKQLEQQGVSVQDSYPDPDEMKSFVSSQLDIWRRLVADEGIERE
ncbi:Bug family tripartite tricarboxylate transporter substrate binding protein [Acidovorax carolinensis]|uniref:Uncharacterized protein n=1 Tax=Acidovorax carolinensis TaxID=553814 RepID=A0A240TR80_9BURK|nr:tripartite tricarboxylate transporter substrate binding protein [Acidovorax carolinensis]ART47643.1 hypothetical protein CBP33_05490 [Acidovorax carolinensis]ART51201.1 hypothetical protein CBP34_05325 [Acidovorax carolinensis]